MKQEGQGKSVSFYKEKQAEVRLLLALLRSI